VSLSSDRNVETAVKALRDHLRLTSDIIVEAIASRAMSFDTRQDTRARGRGERLSRSTRRMELKLKH
jgi:hypothetical protein